MSAFMRVLRLQGLFRAMSTEHQEQLIKAADELHQEDLLEEMLSKQLHNEIQAAMRKPDGIENSLMFSRLPAEIRHEIWSYVVVLPEQIHVFAPHDNDIHGFRLSICGDGVDTNYGRCSCENGRSFSGAVTKPYLDTSLLLVSKSVRREVLDVLFARNHFTFTSLRDLQNFCGTFRTSASKLQHLRIYDRADDYPCSDYRAKRIQKARRRIGNLQTIDMKVYLCDWTSYEKIHEDAFLNEICHFAFPPPEKFECTVRFPGRLTGRRSEPEINMAERITKRLRKIFQGEWKTVEEIPFSEAPPHKVRDEDKPLKCKKGIMALRD